MIIIFPVVSYADVDKTVKVDAVITPANPSSFSLNFDSVSFSGTTGTTLLEGKPSLSDSKTDAAKYTVTANGNYDVYISASNLVSPDGKTISSKRIITNQYGSYANNNYGTSEGSLKLAPTPTKLYTGSKENEIDHFLEFQLDVDPGHDYDNDSDVLNGLSGPTDFSSQITITYTGL
jgi:hypothetical protein